jgi:thiamine-monophosphate kinase
VPESRGEFELIAALTRGLPAGERVVLGVGDDAAVLRPAPDRDLVATTDTFVEGRHFRRELLTPSEVGARLAAANLSDVAAMGAAPLWALVSFVVPATWDAEALRELERACAGTLAASGAAVVGGNLAAAEGPLAATVTLLGEVERGRAWTRAGARAGDRLLVTGAPGSSGAALALAMWGNPPSWESVPAALRAAHVAPTPRVAFARALAATDAVRAAIDVSDGLAADLAHLCEASGVGARLREESLPVTPALAEAARALSAFAGQERGVLPAPASGLVAWFLSGPSDDYELLLAVDPAQLGTARRIANEHGVPLTEVGECTTGRDLVLVCGGEERSIEPHGWDHFAR